VIYLRKTPSSQPTPANASIGTTDPQASVWNGRYREARHYRRKTPNMKCAQASKSLAILHSFNSHIGRPEGPRGGTAVCSAAAPRTAHDAYKQKSQLLDTSDPGLRATVSRKAPAGEALTIGVAGPATSKAEALPYCLTFV
jgi:hypothetical protein